MRCNRVIQIFTLWWQLWWPTYAVPMMMMAKDRRCQRTVSRSRWRREICKIPIGKSTLLWLKNLERFRLKWQVKGRNRKEGRKTEQLLRNLTFPCCLKCLRLCAATYGKRVWGLSWNWYYLIVCRMVDSTYKCGPLYMYRYVICK